VFRKSNKIDPAALFSAPHQKQAGEFIATTCGRVYRLSGLELGKSGPQKSERASPVSQFGDSMA